MRDKLTQPQTQPATTHYHNHTIRAESPQPQLQPSTLPTEFNDRLDMLQLGCTPAKIEEMD